MFETKPTLLLLKDPDEEYHRASIERDFLPLFIPVLAEQAENESDLIDKVSNFKDTSYWGVISTSKRASFAFKSALDNLLASLGNDACLIMEHWKSKIFFAPGKASAQPFLDHSLQVKGAETTGDAASLAKFIIQYIEELSAEEKQGYQNKKLIFLTGDKTRDELSSILAEANIALEHLQVYSTFSNPNLIPMLEVAQQNIIDRFDWVVFFSPSGADLTLATLKQSPDWPSTKIAAIGNTTKSHLESKGVYVHVVPEVPEAEHLIESICNASNVLSQ